MSAQLGLLNPAVNITAMNMIAMNNPMRRSKSLKSPFQTNAAPASECAMPQMILEVLRSLPRGKMPVPATPQAFTRAPPVNTVQIRRYPRKTHRIQCPNRSVQPWSNEVPVAICQRATPSFRNHLSNAPIQAAHNKVSPWREPARLAVSRSPAPTPVAAMRIPGPSSASEANLGLTRSTDFSTLEFALATRGWRRKLWLKYERIGRVRQSWVARTRGL